MNEQEIEKTGAPELEQLKQECASLRRQTVYQLVAMIVLSCTLCAFLYLQRRYAKAELEAIKPRANAMIQSYQNLGVKLGEYGRTHPDFAPILNKYGIPLSGPTSGVPSTATAPKPSSK